ncbi:hypothetical protein AAVH_36415, partial [Aphelenchoides avenae]
VYTVDGCVQTLPELKQTGLQCDMDKKQSSKEHRHHDHHREEYQQKQIVFDDHARASIALRDDPPTTFTTTEQIEERERHERVLYGDGATRRVPMSSGEEFRREECAEETRYDNYTYPANRRRYQQNRQHSPKHVRYGGVSPHRAASYEDERRLQSKLSDRLRQRDGFRESEHVTERFEETITEEHEERRRYGGGQETCRGEVIHSARPSYLR